MCNVYAVLRSIQIEMGELNSQPASHPAIQLAVAFSLRRLFVFTHHKLHARATLVRAEIMFNTLIPSKNDEYHARSYSRRQDIQFFFPGHHRLRNSSRSSSSGSRLSFILNFSVPLLSSSFSSFLFSLSFDFFFVNFMYGNWINGSFGLPAT